MNAEQFPINEERGVDSKEVLKIKMDIERGVISDFCDGDIHNTKKVNEWIQKYSRAFREIFEMMLKEDSDFLLKAQTDQQRVVSEIVSLLRKAQ